MITYIRLVLVWFWFGFKPYQNHTKTIPKPYQNQTKTKPKPYHKFVYFGLVFEAEPASKTNQKRTKNQTNICVQHEHSIYSLIKCCCTDICLVRWLNTGLFAKNIAPTLSTFTMIGYSTSTCINSNICFTKIFSEHNSDNA